jgi:3',5'-cyclic AMP phosphodiesterase CpdA
MNAWILLGDNAYPDGTDAELQAKFFNIYKDDLLKKWALFPAPGNHDYHDIEFSAAVAQKTHEIAYYQDFSMPANGESGGLPSHTNAFYSFDIGNVHFLSLDSYGKEENVYSMYDTLGPQVQWIKKDLQANTNRQWIVAYWHHPPYTMGSHSSDHEGDLVKIRENFIRILERYGVDLILCGHSHDYERSSLMKGYYGKEVNFSAAAYDLSTSSGRYDGTPNSCPYIKSSPNSAGTVYVVSGSAGQLGGKQPGYPHNAMLYSNADIGGASMLEIRDNRLDLKWICSDGVIRDQFSLMKDVGKTTTIQLKKGESTLLTASFVSDHYTWNKTADTARQLTVTPPEGKTIYEVKDGMGCLKDTFEVTVTR